MYSHRAPKLDLYLMQKQGAFVWSDVVRPASQRGARQHTGLGRQDARLVPRYTRESVSLTGVSAKGGCLLIHEAALVSRWGHGKIQVSLHTLESVSLCHGARRKPSASLCTQKRLSHGGQGEIRMPPHALGITSLKRARRDLVQSSYTHKCRSSSLAHESRRRYVETKKTMLVNEIECF